MQWKGWSRSCTYDWILAGLVKSVKITSLEVPRIIENGSVPTVILDCEYTYSDDEETGLVVKWYLNGKPVPVYQWIPPQKPQALGALSDRLNLEYMASDHSHHMHRALAIKRPTTDLSGVYKCSVSSLLDEDSKEQRMVVFGEDQYCYIVWERQISLSHTFFRTIPYTKVYIYFICI